MKKFYITTSIAYTNAPPHIGFALELIQADVVARYQRQKGKDVWFLTGTDEHGLKIAEKAKELGKTPKEFSSEMFEKFRTLAEKLNISHNDFIRTTDKEKHWPGVVKLWKKLEAKKDIYEKDYEGLYCVGCEAFLLPKDLVDGKCPFHQKEPSVVKEKNYFFRLSKYSEIIKEKILKNEIEIVPLSRRNETVAFLENGLEDVSFSRPKEKVEWGIPVPGDENQKIYVWADALTNYISAVGYGKDEKQFKNYWPADIHFIGKDIFKFHSLIWPGMLLSAELELPEKIFIHGFLTVDGVKMSKSLGNVVDPFELIDEYGVDAVRYYFLREISSFEDGDFSHKKFKERYNGDLASGLGNLVARVIKLAEISDCSFSDSNEFYNTDFQEMINNTRKNYDEALDSFKFNEALIAVWKVINFCDKYIEKEKPWQESEKRKEVIGDLLLAINEIAERLKPFMPETSEKIIGQIKSRKSEPLFKRII